LMARPQSVWSCRSGIAWTKLKLGGPTGVHRSSASHRRRITLIIFYLIGATLRGTLGREGPKLRWGSRDRVRGRGGPYAAQGEIMSRVIAEPGAEAKTSLGQSCRTPCQLAVQPGSDFSVTLALSGYQPQTVSVRPEAEGASVPPRLAPNPVQVTLQAVRPPKKPVAKKKTPVAAAARSAASTAAPAPAPTAACRPG
jgi:hypothetical protein